MRKNLGLLGVVMGVMFLAASLVVPATASAMTTADPVSAMMATDATFDAFRIQMYAAHGYGMTPGGAGLTTGGDIMNNSVRNAGGLPMMFLSSINTNITAADMTAINANFAALPALAAGIPPAGKYTTDFSSIGQMYGARTTQASGYDTPQQWDIALGVLNAIFPAAEAGMIAQMPNIWMMTFRDFGAYNPIINTASLAAIDAGLAAAGLAPAVPAPSTLFLLGSGLIGLVGIRRSRKS